MHKTCRLLDMMHVDKSASVNEASLEPAKIFGKDLELSLQIQRQQTKYTYT